MSRGLYNASTPANIGKFLSLWIERFYICGGSIPSHVQDCKKEIFEQFFTKSVFKIGPLSNGLQKGPQGVTVTLPSFVFPLPMLSFLLSLSKPLLLSYDVVVLPLFCFFQSSPNLLPRSLPAPLFAREKSKKDIIEERREKDRWCNYKVGSISTIRISSLSSSSCLDPSSALSYLHLPLFSSVYKRILKLITTTQ